MRSFARDFSSSRRAPPNAALNPPSVSASSRLFVFSRPQHFCVPSENGLAPRCDRFFVPVNDQLRADFFRVRVAKLDHLWEFVAGVDMQQRKRNLAGEERLLRQPQHHRRIFANRIHHHRVRKFGDGFSQDVDALRFEHAEMAQPSRIANRSGLRDRLRFAAFDFFRCALHHS